MTAALLTLLAVMTAAALALTLLPLRRGVHDPAAAERGRLTAERDDLYARLRALAPSDPLEHGQGAHGPSLERERAVLETRAAQVLRQLDALPAAPPPQPRLGGSRRQASVAWAAALALTALGALTVFPQWQRTGLGAAEAAQVTAATRLPGLREAARRDPTTERLNAWGDAAFEQSAYLDALEAYTASLKLEPRQAQPLRRLGTLLLNREGITGQPVSPQEAGQAFLLIRTAASLAPDDAESQLLLGYALVKFGQDREALTALERYRELNPQGRDADELITSIRTAGDSASPALAVYAASCASCHGPAGNGALGPSLRTSALTREAATLIIQRGRGTMPGFPDLTGDQLEGLLDLLAEWQQGSLPASQPAQDTRPAQSTQPAQNNQPAPEKEDTP